MRRSAENRGYRTLENFANELGVTKADYIDYESGKREILASLLIALIERGSIDPAWVLMGKRIGSVAKSAQAAGLAYVAILEAAQRAGVTLTPATFTYAMRPAWPVAVRAKVIDPEHADVLVKLATINSDRLP